MLAFGVLEIERTQTGFLISTLRNDLKARYCPLFSRRSEGFEIVPLARSEQLKDRFAVMDSARVTLDLQPKPMTNGPIELLLCGCSGETEALVSCAPYIETICGWSCALGLGPKLRERVELSDVVQEVLVEVVRQFPQFSGESEAAVMGWLLAAGRPKISRPRPLSSPRQTRQDPRWPSARCRSRMWGLHPETKSGRLIDVVARSQGSASQVVSKREQFDVLADALAALAEHEADVVWLYFGENLTFEVIGQRLNLSRKSVSRIVGQSLKKLKRSLDGPPGGALKYDEAPANCGGSARRRSKPAFGEQSR